VEAADGGTLFLDEIGEIDHSLQAKLLKLLEEKTVRRIGAVKERKVNLPIMSATNRDLQAMVKQGTFRSDLYFRPRIISIAVSSLRSRGEDILQLARHFLDAHGAQAGAALQRGDRTGPAAVLLAGQRAGIAQHAGADCAARARQSDLLRAAYRMLPTREWQRDHLGL
jgi:DNA-binding NtrC family response regulator